MSEGPLLQCSDLTFRYSAKQPPVFEDLSLSVSEGETVLLMGPSGGGKSSLAYCLAGLYPAYAGEMSGQIELAGKPLADYGPAERARTVSILFQDPDDQFCMDRVDHEILFALENIHYQGDLMARVKELLALVGLEAVQTAMIHTLSGGTKQKLALATAMATGARLLILDEPFANLDPASCIQIARTLRELNRQGLTMLIVDHRPDYWKSFLTRVLLLEKKGPPTCLHREELDTRQEEFAARGLFQDDRWLQDCRPPALPAEGGVMAQARDLTLFHGRTPFLKGLSFTLPKGSVTALVGRNGSGKSTLLTALAGVGKYRGELTVHGRVGLVFQNPRFQFLALTVEEEVVTTLKVLHPDAPPEQLAAMADELLETFGLLEKKTASPYALSQGQQRRLALLAMLAGDRPLLLLDEPTYAQDERSSIFILELLRQRVAQGLTAVIATHDLVLAGSCANQILLLEGGALTHMTQEEFARYAAERRVTA